jgi:hypothetical protein
MERTQGVAAGVAVVAAHLAVVGALSTEEPAAAAVIDAVDRTAASAPDDGSAGCLAALLASSPPTSDDPCLSDWWRFQHYLATLPRMLS